mgnify:CR=1 FL=1
MSGVGTDIRRGPAAAARKAPLLREQRVAGLGEDARGRGFRSRHVGTGAGRHGGGRGPGRKKKGDAGDADQVGFGHGGGVQAAPVGYIELSGGQATYKRIADPARPMAIALLFPLVGAIAVAIVALSSRLRSRG